MPSTQAGNTRSGVEFPITIGEIAPPEGYVRQGTSENTFTSWLRQFPLKPQGSPVLLHTGEKKYTQELHYAVLAIDVGTRDLQQCADAVMRLRAEYLYQSGLADQIAFNFTSGDRIPFNKWSAGNKPVVERNDVEWESCSSCNGSASSFRKYMDVIFTYAGTSSLAKELKPVSLAEMQAGDVLIKGGFPGHAMLVVDVVQNAQGEMAFMLAQSYMPAQSIHIVKNPANADGSPWFFLNAIDEAVVTSEWTFSSKDLARFVE